MEDSELVISFEDSVSNNSSNFDPSSTGGENSLFEGKSTNGALFSKQPSDSESLALAQSPRVNNHQPSKLLLVSLIESVCHLYGDTVEMKRKIFVKLCQRLHQLGILHYEFSDELASLRYSYHRAFSHLVYETTAIVKRDSPRLITTSDSFLSIDQSRYSSDFFEESMIGRGGFASAWRARNKLDDIVYAIKKIRLLGDDHKYENIFREIKSLARLDHRNVVRYYSSWLEYASIMEKEESDSEDGEYTEARTSGTNKVNGFILYIQMQLCPTTLHECITTRNRRKTLHDEVDFRKNNIHLFRQILEGASYVHQQGLIHRDLKPSNIFLSYDAGVAVPKIGDFGLAASIVEQVDAQTDDSSTPKITVVDELSSSPSGSRLDLFNAVAKKSNVILDPETMTMLMNSEEGAFKFPLKEKSRTIGVGTRTYAAPEQLAGTTYDEKADIYSLGVILFELFQPFSTAMERSHLLNDLKIHKKLPEAFKERYPEESKWILQMTHTEPCKRPSASTLFEVFKCDDDTLHGKFQQIKREKEELERRLHDIEAQLERIKVQDEPNLQISHSLSKMLEK